MVIAMKMRDRGTMIRLGIDCDWAAHGLKGEINNDCEACSTLFLIERRLTSNRVSRRSPVHNVYVVVHTFLCTNLFCCTRYLDLANVTELYPSNFVCINALFPQPPPQA